MMTGELQNSKVTFRAPAGDAEWDVIVSLRNEANPEKPIDRLMLDEEDRLFPARLKRERAVGLVGQEIVANILVTETEMYKEPGRIEFTITDPKNNYLEDCFCWVTESSKRMNGRILSASVPSFNPELFNFYLDKGFEIQQRDPISRLDLNDDAVDSKLKNFSKLKDDSVELLKWDQFHERNKDKPVQIISGQEYPYELVLLWQFFNVVIHDVPSPEPFQDITIELFEKYMASPLFNQELLFLAVNENQIVGMSTLQPNRVRNDLYHTGLTGVRREFRRKSIASALKLVAIDTARRNGIRYIATSNEENNPMYQLNLALGFNPWYENYIMAQKL